jgi:hypothetical protein
MKGCIKIVMILSLSTVAVADPGRDHLEVYLTELLAAVGQGKEAILFKPSKHWSSPKNHFSVIQFIKRHQPVSWSLGEVKKAGDYMAINVVFRTRFWEHPWMTSFELIRQGERWWVADFTDITRRPLTTEPDGAKELFSIWLDQAVEGMVQIDQSADKTSSNAISRYYHSGMGFWSNPLKSRLWFLWLTSNHPEPVARIEVVSEGVSVTSLKASFSGGKIRQPTTSFLFSMEVKDGKWSITGYENMATSERQKKRVESARQFMEQMAGVEMEQGSAEATVRSQLAILAAAAEGSNKPTLMTEILRQSEPLWAVTKKARSSLGKLIAMSMAVQGSQEQWSVELESGTAQRGYVVAVPASEGPLFKGIRFELTPEESVWVIQSAVLFR